MTLDTTSLFTCEIFMSSTCHSTVHCFPLIVLFETHQSLGFTSKTQQIRVCDRSMLVQFDMDENLFVFLVHVFGIQFWV